MFERRFQDQLLRSLAALRHGSLRLTTPDGQVRDFVGPAPGPAAELTIADWRAVPALEAKGDIGLTEAYRDGWVETPDLTALLTLGLVNESALDRYVHGHPIQALAARLIYLMNRNTRAGSRRITIWAMISIGCGWTRRWPTPRPSTGRATIWWRRSTANMTA